MAKIYSLSFGTGDPRTYTGLAPTFLIFVRLTDGATIAPPAISESLTSSGLYQFTYGTTQPISFLADAATTSPGAVARYVAGQIDPADRTDEYAATMIAIGTSGIALGTTGIAIGTSGIALGTTMVAIGTSAIALGITNVALGTTNVALGTTSVALGITGIALGTTTVALGTTTVALGVTNVGIGLTILTQLSGASSPVVNLIGSAGSTFGSSATDPIDLFGYVKRIVENLEGNQSFTKSTGALTILTRGSSTTLASKTITNTATAVTKT